MNTFKLRLEAHDNVSHPGSTRDEILHWNNRYRQSLMRCGLKIVESEDELPADLNQFVTAPIVCPGSLNPWKQPSFIVAMTDGEWAAAREGAQTPRAPTAEPGSLAKITMSFTPHEWRLLAIAAAKINRGSFINKDHHAEVHALALVIAERTGQAS